MTTLCPHGTFLSLCEFIRRDPIQGKVHSCAEERIPAMALIVNSVNIVLDRHVFYSISLPLCNLPAAATLSQANKATKTFPFQEGKYYQLLSLQSASEHKALSLRNMNNEDGRGEIENARIQIYDNYRLLS
jgi:hypothetical protein